MPGRITGTCNPISSITAGIAPARECGFRFMKNGAQGLAIVLYLAMMLAVVVGVDVAFFRNRFWERLIANIGIVLLFAAFYLRFLRRP